MPGPRAKIAIVTVVALAGMAVVLVSAMLKQARVSCEVCVTFRGRTQCRNAAGPDPAQAARTARDNACGILASGMTASIECANTPPDSVRCEP